MSKLKYNFEQKCMATIKNNTSKKTYRQGINKFEEYLEEKNISQRKAIRASSNGDVDFVQKYCDWLAGLHSATPQMAAQNCPLMPGDRRSAYSAPCNSSSLTNYIPA